MGKVSTAKRVEREQTTIRLPADLKEKIHQEAEKRGESFNGMVMIMLNKAWELMNQGQL